MPQSSKELINVHLVESLNSLQAAVHQFKVGNTERAEAFIKSAKPHIDLLQQAVNKKSVKP